MLFEEIGVSKLAFPVLPFLIIGHIILRRPPHQMGAPNHNMNATIEQIVFSVYSVAIVGVFGNFLIGWELGKRGFYQNGLRNRPGIGVIFAVLAFIGMVLWQSIAKLSNPLSSWRYVWVPACGVLSWLISRQLIPRSMRLYSRAKCLHETAYVGDWRSTLQSITLAEIRSNPRLLIAEVFYRQALEVQNHLADQASNDTERFFHEQNVVVTYFQLALLHLQRREFEEASKHSGQAVRLLERLTAGAGYSKELGNLLSKALFLNAEADHALHKFQEAQQKYAQSLTLGKRFGNEDSNAITERNLQEVIAAQKAERNEL